jgi:hypothetical protein
MNAWVDFTKVDNIEFDQVDWNDYPKFVDAYIISADHNGRPATNAELDTINENGDFVHEALWNTLL